MQKETGLLERVFHLSENGTSVKTEIMAGITTFMTMAYILAVNPAIMSAAGMDKGAVLTATAIAGFLGTVLMAVFSNYPFALAPGMGLNAFFLHRRKADGLHLGNGTGCRLRRGCHLHRALSHECP